MSGTPAAADTSDTLDPAVWRIAAVAFIGPFMTQLDSTVVNVSLPTIREELHASIATAQWMVSGYLLALALMLPINGWLVDRVGAKRLYLGCFTAFTLASLLCGAARTMEQIIAARVLQGMAGGLLAPMAQMMIARAAGRHMARVMGYTVVPILIAPIVGPVLSGAILKWANWPWLFYLNLPIGILGVTLSMLLLPSDDATLQRRPFDAVGFLLISPGLAALLYGLQHASTAQGWLPLASGAVLFARHARHKGNAALIDLDLFGGRIFRAAAATQFFSTAMLYARQFLVPLYLIVGCALPASEAGWLVAAVGLGMMCSFPVVGALTDRFGCRAVSASGALLSTLGVLPFLWMAGHTLSLPLAAVSLFVGGVGQGTISIPSVSAAYASVPKARLAVANTALNIVQRLGGPIATTVIATVMSAASSATSSAMSSATSSASASGAAAAAGAPASTTAFMAAFCLLAGVHLLALAFATRLPVRIH